MLKPETKTIGDHSYTTTQLDAVRGRRVFMRLARIVGPAFAEMGGSQDETGLARAFGVAIKNLSEDDLDYFCDVFADATTVTGGKYGAKAPLLKDVFSLHFAANYGDMTAWLVFCMKVNFGSFFGSAAQLVGRAGAA